MDGVDIDYNAFLDIPVDNNDVMNQNNNFNEGNLIRNENIIRNEIRRDYFFYEITSIFMDSFFDFQLSLNEPNDLNDQNSINRALNKFFQEQISAKAFLSLIRVCFLYFLFYLDGYKIAVPMIFIIIFLLLHEACLITNYIFMKIYFFFFYLCDNNNNQLRKFPKFILIFDIFASLIYFFWFIYGVYHIMLYPEIFDVAIAKNTYIVYYVILFILFGFFQFSRLIFLLIMFIFFYPCFNYLMYISYYNLYIRIIRNHKLAMELKPVTFKEYLNKTKEQVDDVGICIICTEQFNINDSVIYLKCNNKHVFHDYCIKQWIGKKAECPICRRDLTQT